MFSKKYQEHWKGLLRSRTEDWERRVVFADESSKVNIKNSKHHHKVRLAFFYLFIFFTSLHFAMKLARATENQVGLVSLLLFAA